jgi:hypothetical protein
MRLWLAGIGVCILAGSTLPALPRAIATAFAPAIATDGMFSSSPDHPAIGYGKPTETDRIAGLNRAIREEQIRLEFDPVRGYLTSVMRALDLPRESQVLVFSQTSLQASLIGPGSPRAILFDDTLALAWIPRAPLLEVAVQDPTQGVIFYGLRQLSLLIPQFQRMDATCLTCHVSPTTPGVPGVGIASVAVDAAGLPSSGAAFSTDHRTPFEQRWGGWFVTGSGSVRHRGNGNLANEVARVYPASSSDALALMVPDHQAHMANLITRLGWEARIAGTSASEAVNASVNELVDYMLFIEEAKLPASLATTSPFATMFMRVGPRDSRGRSLREFDLRQRMFRYPCSYMIYTPAFDALPPSAQDAIYRRLSDVLLGKVADPRYERLSPTDRQAVLEILRETNARADAFF